MLRPITSARISPYIALPAAAGAAAAIVALIAGAKNKMGYAKAVGAAVLGGVACAYWRSGFGKVLERVTGFLRGTETRATKEAAQAHFSLVGLKQAARDEACQEFQKTHGEKALQTVLAAEIYAFHQEPIAPGSSTLNGEISVTDPRHVEVVNRAVQTLSPHFALPLFLRDTAAQYYRKVIAPKDALPTPEEKVRRLGKASAQLHARVYEALLGLENGTYRASGVINGMLLATAALEKGEYPLDAYRALVDDSIAQLEVQGLEGLSPAASAASIKDLRRAALSPDNLQLLRWTATEFKRLAELEVGEFLTRHHASADHPPIFLLQIATKELSFLAFEGFARRVVDGLWKAQSAEVEDVSQVRSTRELVEEHLNRGVLPENKAVLHAYLDEAIARTYVAACREQGKTPLQSSQDRAALGSVVSGIVEQL